MGSNALMTERLSNESKICGQNLPLKKSKLENSKKVQKANIITIKVEEIYLVNSTLKNAKKNLKKMDKIYDKINKINFKEIRHKLGCFHPLLIYYEVCFIFMAEIIHIQKELINDFKCSRQPLKIDEILYKIKLLLKL